MAEDHFLQCLNQPITASLGYRHPPHLECGGHDADHESGAGGIRAQSSMQDPGGEQGSNFWALEAIRQPDCTVTRREALELARIRLSGSRKEDAPSTV